MSTENSSISIIISYHNEGSLLLRAIESVNQQTYKGDVEIIVVDDASDEAPRLPAGSRFPVRLIRTDTNLHAAGARNLGIKHAARALIGFLDADDIYVPDKIEKQVAFLNAHPDVLAVGGSIHVHREGKQWLQIPKVVLNCYPSHAEQSCVLPDNIRHDLCLYYGFNTCCTTFRIDALMQIGGFDASYRWGEEWDVLVRLAQTGRLGYIPDPAAHYLCRSGSITSTLNPEKYESGARMCRAWRNGIETLPLSHKQYLRDRERDWHLLAAQVYLENRGAPVVAFRHAFQSLVCRPSVWGARSTVRSLMHMAFLPFRHSSP